MSAKNKRSKRRMDLLEIPETERGNIIAKLRQTLQQNVAEIKLWNHLLQCETLTINGQIVFSSDGSFDGLLI